MARPTKLTPELQDRIVKAVRAGNYAEAAARSCGIGASTYYRWLQRGTIESAGIYAEFADAVRRAEGEAEVHAVAILRRRWARTGAPPWPTWSVATRVAGVATPPRS